MDDKAFDPAYREGTLLLHQGKPGKALPLLEEAYRINPDNVDAALNLSGAYILTKKFKRAIEVLESICDVAGDNAMVWTNLGAAYLGNPILADKEDQLKAIAAFERALEINPVAPNVAYNIGLIYRDRKEFGAAKYWFGQAIKSNPNDRDAQRILEKLREVE